MTNKTVEAIKNGQEVVIEEMFELINAYNLTNLEVYREDDGIRLTEIFINSFEDYGDTYKFYQSYTDENMYLLEKSDIIGTEFRLEEKSDILINTCTLSDGKFMDLIIYNVSQDFKTSEREGYHLIELEELNEFLENTLGENAEYRCMSVRYFDKFSMDLKMTCPERTYINTLDDTDWKLHISDTMTTLEVSVSSEECMNEFYRKDDGTSVSIIVKPYGQPFAEIRMLFFKNDN